jgi:hypothetical protein
MDRKTESGAWDRFGLTLDSRAPGKSILTGEHSNLEKTTISLTSLHCEHEPPFLMLFLFAIRF